MPEGPEVKKQAMALAEAVSGKTLVGIEILSGRYHKKPPSGIDQFAQSLPIKIVGAGCHGKFIYFILHDEYSIWCTLGMTGLWSESQAKHSRLCFHMNDSKIYFEDQRNFGTIKFVRGKFNLIEKLKSLGPDMLSQDVTDEEFISRLRKKDHWQVSKALMDQSIVAGVGNYIKADSLWLSRISPKRLVKEISDKELTTLSRCIKQVMQESYRSGGATIQTYRNMDGTEGEYNRRFLVYNQKQDPDGNEVIRETTSDNRTTHWCPKVQI